MFAKKTKTTETYILPEEFDTYTKDGYVIFMTRPTMFGTYRAVKIEVQKHTEPAAVVISDRFDRKPINRIVKFWSHFHQQYFSI